jgi:hypothetical protein
MSESDDRRVQLHALFVLELGVRRRGFAEPAIHRALIFCSATRAVPERFRRRAEVRFRGRTVEAGRIHG